MNMCYLTNRIAVAFCLGLGLLNLHQAGAQTAEQAQNTQPGVEVPPQSRMPTHPPVPALAPGLVPTTLAVPTSSATQTPRRSLPASNQSVKQLAPAQPAQVKLVAIYHGSGFFDAGLAEKLRPELAKAFGITPASSSKPGDGPADLLRSVLGQNKSPDNTTNQNNITKTGQP
jgi:hypothetical protein